MKKINMSYLINSLMLQTSSKPLAQTSFKVMKTIQNDNIENQILSIAILLLLFLDKYNLSHIDVLAMADRLIYCAYNNNMADEYKKIMKLMKTKKEILN